MNDFSQKRFVDLGQTVFQDLVRGYHENVHTHDTYGEVEDHRIVYEWFAEMSFEAAAEFSKVFAHQEDN